MTDEHSQDQREREDLLRRHREISETLRRTMLALLTFSLFCWLTAVGSPDRSLIVSEPTVEIPFIDVALSFPVFLIVAPFLLIVFAIYLHVFFQERLKLEALLGSGEGGRAAALFNFNAPAARLLTGFVVYWLVPLTLGAIAWKALARSEWSLPMIAVTMTVTAGLSLVQNVRSAGSTSLGWAGLTYAGLAVVIGAFFFLAPPWMVRRPLDLYRADLEDAWLLGADLAGADLRWANLAGADLAGADLAGADLRWANVARADLTGARLAGADLRGTGSLTEAILTGAELTGVDLTGADLAEADLTEARLTGADLAEADLTRAVLTKAGLTGTNLFQATLARANLAEADLTRAKLTWANLAKADLTGANLTWANLTWANLAEADLTRADLTYANLNWAILTGVNLTRAKLTSASVARANLTGARLAGADLSWADLAEADLTEADLTGANFADPAHPNLGGVNFARLEPAEAAKLCNTTLPDGSISRRDCLDDKPRRQQ